MQRRWMWILLVLLMIGLSFVFGFVMRDLLRDYLVKPLQAVFLRVQNTWRSLDPDAVWGLFLLLAFFMMIYSFPPVQQEVDRVLARPRLLSTGATQLTSSIRQEQRGRLEFWLIEVDHIYHSRLVLRLAVIELKKLVLELIAFQQGLPSRSQAERWLKAHVQEVPPAVYELFNSVNVASQERLPWYLFWKPLVSRFSQVPASLNAQQVEAILQYLESGETGSIP